MQEVPSSAIKYPVLHSEHVVAVAHTLQFETSSLHYVQDVPSAASKNPSLHSVHKVESVAHSEQPDKVHVSHVLSPFTP